MTDPIHDSRNQAQVDTRANLFYFLQSMSGLANDKCRLPSAECPILDDQNQTNPVQSSLAL